MTHQETRTRLLETALQLIWQSNYNSVGVNEICKQAGVTKGSFYHHFESKAVLLCEAMEYYWESTRQLVDEIMSPMHSPLEQLERYIQFIFERKFDEAAGRVRGCPYFASSSLTGCEDEMIIRSQQKLLENGVKYNAALIKNLLADDYLEGEIDPARMGRLMSQYIHGVVSYARVSSDIPTVKADLTEGLFRLINLKPEYWFAIKQASNLNTEANA